MRIRLFKGGNPFARKRRPGQRFAWLPKRLTNGTIVWLEWYSRKRGTYGVCGGRYLN